MALYGVVLFAASASIAVRLRSPRLFLPSLLAYLTVHLASGTGILLEVVPDRGRPGQAEKVDVLTMRRVGH